MTKLVVTRELVGKVVCSSYVTHQKVISYSWIVAITSAYSPLKSTSSTITFNRQKRSWNLSISLANVPTRSWVLLLVAGLRRSVVNHSVASYVIRHGGKWIASHSWNFLSHENFCRARQVTQGGCDQVVGQSQSITGQSEVGRKCITPIGPWLWSWGPSVCR